MTYKIVKKDGRFVQRTYEIEKKLFHKFTVVAAKQKRKHKHIINELLEEYVKKYSLKRYKR